MSTTILAQIMGPVLVAAGIGFLLHPKFYAKIIKDFEECEGLTYFAGISIMILGLIVVLNHNIWEFSAAGLVTLLAWGSLVKGAIFLIAPNLLFDISNALMKNSGLMKIAMVFALAAGGYLSYAGYGYFV
ncbi:hypothetical protein KKF38_04630 [Patescibacteria group bacterium]|nr:hypothetical protein [Patescibacteria group bacterium]